MYTTLPTGSDRLCELFQLLLRFGKLSKTGWKACPGTQQFVSRPRPRLLESGAFWAQDCSTFFRDLGPVRVRTERNLSSVVEKDSAAGLAFPIFFLLFDTDWNRSPKLKFRRFSIARRTAIANFVIGARLLAPTFLPSSLFLHTVHDLLYTNNYKRCRKRSIAAAFAPFGLWPAPEARSNITFNRFIHARNVSTKKICRHIENTYFNFAIKFVQPCRIFSTFELGK